MFIRPQCTYVHYNKHVKEYSNKATIYTETMPQESTRITTLLGNLYLTTLIKKILLNNMLYQMGPSESQSCFFIH